MDTQMPTPDQGHEPTSKPTSDSADEPTGEQLHKSAQAGPGEKPREKSGEAPSETSSQTPSETSSEAPGEARGETRGEKPGRVRSILALVTSLVVVAAMAYVVVDGPTLWGHSRTYSQPLGLNDSQVTGQAAAGPVAAVVVEPAPVQLLCPPPVFLADGASVGDQQFSAVPVAIRSDVVIGTPELGVGQSTEITVPGQAGQVVLAAGLVTSLTTAGDLRGLVAAPCTSPAVSQWLVGGGASRGGSDLLTVYNPSATPATVTLNVYGESGPVHLTTGAMFVVAPGQMVVTRLDAVAAGQQQLVVHVRSAGAQVVSSMQTHSINGLVPQGIDIVSPATAPAQHVLVPGLVSEGQDSLDMDVPLLRLMNTTSSQGTASVTLWADRGMVPADRPGLEHLLTVDLPPHTVLDLPLGGLAPGQYVAQIHSDVPLVAGGRWSRQGDIPAGSLLTAPPVDVTWLPAVPLPAPGSQAAVMLPDVQALAGQAGLEAVDIRIAVLALPHLSDADADADADALTDVGADGGGEFDAGEGDVGPDGVGAGGTHDPNEGFVALMGTHYLGQEGVDISLEPGQVTVLSLADMGIGPEHLPDLLVVRANPGTRLVWSVILTASDQGVVDAEQTTGDSEDGGAQAGASFGDGSGDAAGSAAQDATVPPGQHPLISALVPTPAAVSTGLVRVRQVLSWGSP